MLTLRRVPLSCDSFLPRSDLSPEREFTTLVFPGSFLLSVPEGRGWRKDFSCLGRLPNTISLKESSRQFWGSERVPASGYDAADAATYPSVLCCFFQGSSARRDRVSTCFCVLHARLVPVPRASRRGSLGGRGLVGPQSWAGAVGPQVAVQAWGPAAETCDSKGRSVAGKSRGFWPHHARPRK